MAITSSAKKAHKQSLVKRVFNTRRSRVMKDVISRIDKAVVAKDAKTVTDLLPQAYKAIDKAAKRGIIKKGNAARKKSKVATSLAKLSK